MGGSKIFSEWLSPKQLVVHSKIHANKLYVQVEKCFNCMTADIPKNIKRNVSNITDYCVVVVGGWGGGTGDTSHYWMNEDRNVFWNIKKVHYISVQLPDNSTITSLEKGELPLPESLSSKAKSATVLPQLERSNIISLG